MPSSDNAATRLSIIEQANFASSKPHQVRAQIRQLLDSGELKVREIERFTTYKAPTISQWLNEKYDADPQKVDEAMTRFFRHWLIVNAIVPTAVTNQIHDTMELAWKRLEIARIKGDFGRGKTKAANRFVALNDYAVLVEITAMLSAMELINQIGSALGISPSRGTGSDKLNAVIRSLARREVKPLLIFDEADKLRPRTLSVLQDVYGAEGSGRCGMVLLGTERLDKNLRDPDLGYFRRRITIAQEIGEVSLNEAKKIVDMWPHNLAADDIRQMHTYALKHYGVHTLINLLKRGYDLMQSSDEKRIQPAHIEDAYAYLLN